MKAPEVAYAIPTLVRDGILTPEQAAQPLRAARGELLSIRGELRALLYLGVVLFVAGISLLVKENLDRIGPVAIAGGLALLASGTLSWVLYRAPKFTWAREESSDWSFDSLLLLGILLLGATLAYVESKFTPLGENWSYHLLVMSLITGALALRCDSRLAWSLALSTFAAWRGIAASRVGAEWIGYASMSLRFELIFCGVAFVLLGYALRRFGRKAHFEPLTTFLGALSGLAGLGLFALDATGPWILWAVVFLVAAGSVALFALRSRRFGLFALGAVAAYAAFTRLAFEIAPDPIFGCFWFSSSSVAMIVLLFFVQRRFRALAREGHE